MNGATRYFGKVCESHPELAGERRSANGNCVACARESRKRSHIKKRQAGTRYFGAVCEKHPELAGERRSVNHQCIRCGADSALKSHRKSNYAASAAVKVTNAARVFEHYGAVCAVCGIQDRDVLTIDHANQDGAGHKNNRGERYSGVRLYKWLVDNGFPSNFRVLCFNCNIKAYKLYKRGIS